MSGEWSVGAVSDRDQPRLRHGAEARGVSRACLLAVLLVRAYQVTIRPHLIGSCKFCPTCSEYAITALQRHGLWRGGALALRRLFRCHPFGRGGIDPVP